MTHQELGQKTILATAVLPNIYRMWRDDDEGIEDDKTNDEPEQRNDGRTEEKDYLVGGL